jgi:hypothetical protein
VCRPKIIPKLRLRDEARPPNYTLRHTKTLHKGLIGRLRFIKLTSDDEMPFRRDVREDLGPGSKEEIQPLVGAHQPYEEQVLPLHRKTEATAGDFARGVRVYFRGEYRIPEESNRFICVSFPRHLFGMTQSKSPVHGSHKSSSKKIIPQTPLVRGEVVNKTQMNGLRMIFSDLFSDITATYAHEGQPKGVNHSCI